MVKRDRQIEGSAASSARKRPREADDDDDESRQGRPSEPEKIPPKQGRSSRPTKPRVIFRGKAVVEFLELAQRFLKTYGYKLPFLIADGVAVCREKGKGEAFLEAVLAMLKAVESAPPILNPKTGKFDKTCDYPAHFLGLGPLSKKEKELFFVPLLDPKIFGDRREDFAASTLPTEFDLVSKIPERLIFILLLAIRCVTITHHRSYNGKCLEADLRTMSSKTIEEAFEPILTNSLGGYFGSCARCSSHGWVMAHISQLYSGGRFHHKPWNELKRPVEQFFDLPFRFNLVRVFRDLTFRVDVKVIEDNEEADATFVRGLQAKKYPDYPEYEIDVEWLEKMRRKVGDYDLLGDEDDE